MWNISWMKSWGFNNNIADWCQTVPTGFVMICEFFNWPIVVWFVFSQGADHRRVAWPVAVRHRKKDDATIAGSGWVWIWPPHRAELISWSSWNAGHSDGHSEISGASPGAHWWGSPKENLCWESRSTWAMMVMKLAVAAMPLRWIYEPNQGAGGTTPLAKWWIAIDMIVVTWYTWWNRRFKYKDCLNSWISWKSYNYPGLLSNGQEPKWTVQSHRFLYFRIFQVLLCNNTWCTQPLASRSVAGAFWPACLMKWNRRDDSRHDAFRESTIQTRYWIVDLSTYVNCVALFISYSNVYSLHKRSFWSLLKSHIRQPWSRPL